jgi:trimeric autotransporter adhesin
VETTTRSNRYVGNCVPSSSSITESVCDSYTAPDGQVYTQSGQYNAILTNVADCDSIVAISLTVTQTPVAGFTTTANGLTVQFTSTFTGTGNRLWNFGDGSPSNSQPNPVHTFASQGTFNVCLTIGNNCGIDQACQQVTVCQPTASLLTEQSCGPFTLNGTQYTQSGTFTQTQTNAAGCDSTITLNLTVLQPTASVLTETSCGSFTLNGTEYTQSGNFLQTLTNAAGCDSTITLNLTVNQLPVAAFTRSHNELTVTFTSTSTAANSHLWNFGDGSPGNSQQNPVHAYSGFGQYNVCLTVSNGCGIDQLCQLVTVSEDCEPTSSAITQTACGSYTAPDGQTYATSGSYTAIILNALGCDSTITIQLTVVQPVVLSEEETICEGTSFEMPDGSLATVAGTYNFNGLTALGCDSTYTVELTVDICTGVADGDAGDFLLFPNPASSSVTLVLPDHLSPQPLSVLNALGQEVLRGTVQVGRNEIKLDRFAAGVYAVRVGNGVRRLVVE